MSRPDYGLAAQRAAEAHLAACDHAYEQECDGIEDPEWPNMGGPYCGCVTCLVREVLWVAWPIFMEAAEAVVADGPAV